MNSLACEPLLVLGRSVRKLSSLTGESLTSPPEVTAETSNSCFSMFFRNASGVRPRARRPRNGFGGGGGDSLPLFFGRGETREVVFRGGDGKGLCCVARPQDERR